MTSGRFTERRHRMVRTQIEARGVSNERVLDAMRTVPRHRFVPEKDEASAYEDHPLDIGCGQTISQPYMVAFMTALLELAPTDRVLEIGTGSAYQAAILATLAAEVITIERHEALAQRARALLAELGYGNVTVVVGDGTLGCPEYAPYDAVIVTAAAPHVPRALEEQLKVGGRLVCPSGARDIQRLERIIRTDRGFEEEHGIGCVFVPLIGEDGWPD